jgi:hypothetical protein
MRGKRTRCPNPPCRAVFEVRDEIAAAPAPSSASEATLPGRQVSGSVSDLLPLLPAEQVSPAEAAPPRPKRKSEPGLKTRSIAAPDAAPAVAQAPVLTPEPTSAPALDWGPLTEVFAEQNQPSSTAGEGTSTEPDVLFESASGAWAPPPIRGPGAVLTDGVAKKEEQAGTPALPAPQAARRRSWKAIAAMAAVVAVLAGVVFWQYHRQKTGNEAQRLELASERFRDHNFEDAAARFSKLAADFPDSPAQRQYRFAAEFSGLRQPIYQTQTDAGELTSALQRLCDFIAGFQGDPLLDRYQADLGDTFVTLGKSLLDVAEEKHDPELAKQAEHALDQATALKAAPLQGLRDRLAHVNQGNAAWARKQDVLQRLKTVLADFTFEGMQQALQAADRAGLRKDSEVAALLAKLPAKHRDSVTYERAPEDKPAFLPKEDQEPTLLVLPLLKEGAADLGEDRRPVLALVSGVLYAFDPASNKLLWFRRVSIDSPGLPARVPPTAMMPELILAFLPDNSTLTALDAQHGRPLWCCPLRSPCLGKPLVVGRRVFVATSEGYVEEIDADAGLRLGSYRLGQPLTGEGAVQQGTNLLYFLADKETVYVLDVAARTCAGILYTGHPAGSLRGAPVLIPEAARGPAERAARASLVLSQEEGMDRIKLRVFPMPEAAVNPAAPSWDTILRGWGCFPPFADSERLAQVTDRGRFTLYGVGPRSRGGPHLFRAVPEDVLLGGSQGSRAMIVHADSERFWVLADGELHKLVLTFDHRQGPQLVQPPLAETAFGSALHAAQIRTDAEGKATLYLVTRARDGQTSLVSAVDARRGAMAWQRQAGVLCRGQPRCLGDQMLAEDQAGSLYLFGAGDLAERSDLGSPWIGGEKLPGLSSFGPRYFLRGPAQSLYVITSLTGDPPSVQVQQFQPGKTTSLTSSFPQQASLGGTPGLGADALVLPLANGALARQSLSGGPALAGPNWRAVQADANSTGHVVLLEKDDFLVTDGSRGLKRLRWPAVGLTASKAAVVLPTRIVRAPLVLPPDQAGTARVCVVDAADSLTLLQGDSLRPLRQWTLGGKITAGPFLRGKSIGCVLDHRRLVWLNPDKAGIAWQYGPFDGDIVGEPQLIEEDLVVVADVSGRFLGFNPKSGQVQGPGYTLRANAAPAAAPQSCGAGRLFAPLTDGTILLLSAKHFHNPL